MTEREVDLAGLGDDAIDQVSDALDGNIRLLLQRDGKIVGAIVGLDDLAKLRRADKLQRERLEPILRIGRKFADVPTEVLEREVKKAIVKVKTEMTGVPYQPDWDD